MKYALLFILSFLTLKSFSGQLLVPQNFSTIQSAIDSSNNGDTVLVDNGVYFENLLISSKDITLASKFILTSNFDDIHNTIIDGSSSTGDTASTIRILNGCSPQMKLQGFTIRGGKGTPFNLGGGQIYTEGGGLFIEFSSPEISFNYFTNNSCTVKSGVSLSAGGGAIHTLYDSANIHNNILEGNFGLYGNGIVLNNSNGLFQNNLVYNNRGANEFGAGGVMVFCTVNTSSCRIYNNTIVSNLAISGIGTFAGRGGGLFNIDCDNTIIENNIIYANYQKFGDEIANSGGLNFNTNYNTTTGTLSGNNFTFNPDFLDTSFIANPISPSLDAGNPNSLFNDRENPSSPGNALFPSQGTITNDLGIYGGPNASLFPIIERPIYFQNRYNFNVTNPSPQDTISSTFQIMNLGSKALFIDSLKFKNGNAFIHFDTIRNHNIDPLNNLNIVLKWSSLVPVNDTLIIYHNDTALGSESAINFNIVITDLSNEIQNTKVRLFPNPTEGIITLETELMDIGNYLEVKDLLGRCLIREPISRSRFTIDVSELGPGVYILGISDQTNSNIKFLKY